MGADIHITVGRVNAKMLPAPADEEAGTALALFDNRKIQFGDFEFTSNIPREADINRNYALFAFLANVRGDVKPLMELERLEEATDQFLRWLNDEHVKQLDVPVGWWGGHERDLIGDYAIYDVGDHSRVFYPVQVLLNFDYDQVALVEDDNDTGRDFSKPPLYFPNKDNETYREWFGETYFNFLNWCVRDNWQFAIFGFDN
jgi:hypothetical protein